MATTRPSPRERLLETAGRLFTENGIRAVGIDRLLREAGVAKASLYKTFGSKDELIAEYLRGVDERYRKRWNDGVADLDSPIEKVLYFFDMADRAVREPNFRGSHFLNAANEYPHADTPGEEAIREAVAAHRTWLHETIRAQLIASGLDDEDNVEEITRRLRILYDGAVAGATLEADVNAILRAVSLSRRMATDLLRL